MHQGTFIAQEIPKVQVERENPSVPESPFWHYIRPKIINKNLETYGGNTPASGSETSDLFRRLVNSQSNKRGSDKRQRFNSGHFAKFGLGDQLEKISVRSNSDIRISWIQAGQLKYGRLGSTGKNKQHPTEMPGVVTNITNNNSRTSKSNRNTAIHCGGSGPSSILCERTANAPNKILLSSQNYQAKIFLTNQCKE